MHLSYVHSSYCCEREFPAALEESSACPFMSNVYYCLKAKKDALFPFSATSEHISKGGWLKNHMNCGHLCSHLSGNMKWQGFFVLHCCFMSLVGVRECDKV